MVRVVAVVTLCLGLTLPAFAQEKPSYTEGDQLTVEMLAVHLQTANDACQSLDSVQKYRELANKFTRHVEKTYEGYTVGTNFELTPTVEVTTPAENTNEETEQNN